VQVDSCVAGPSATDADYIKMSSSWTATANACWKLTTQEKCDLNSSCWWAFKATTPNFCTIAPTKVMEDRIDDSCPLKRTLVSKMRDILHCAEQGRATCTGQCVWERFPSCPMYGVRLSCSIDWENIDQELQPFMCGELNSKESCERLIANVGSGLLTSKYIVLFTVLGMGNAW